MLKHVNKIFFKDHQGHKSYSVIYDGDNSSNKFQQSESATRGFTCHGETIGHMSLNKVA